MIQLYKYIKESLLDDEDILMKDTGEDTIKNEILKFLKDNYINGDKCKISKKPINGKYIVDCSNDLRIKNKNITSLTNEYFEFGSISGDFICRGCGSLTSLEGSPKKVGRDFSCANCNSLISLKGAPEKVGGNFDCGNCDSLTSLKCAPEKVGGGFYCYVCNSLTSLKGAPKEVGGNFDCCECDSLTSLEDAPKEVGGHFNCRGCKTKFTEEDVRNVSNVGGKIIC